MSRPLSRLLPGSRRPAAGRPLANPLRALLAAGLSLGAAVAAAQEAAGPEPAPAAPAVAGEAFAPGASLQDERLERLGGTVTTVELGGTVSGNTASQVSTGSNVITEGSLAHSVGFPTVIQNTGANVLIQSATTVNVQLR